MRKILLFAFTLLFFAVFASCGDTRPTFSINHLAIYDANNPAYPLSSPLVVHKGSPFVFKVVFYNAKNEAMDVAKPENIIWSMSPVSTQPWLASSEYTATLIVPATYSGSTGGVSMQVEYGTLPPVSLTFEIQD
ncbi:MAG: hypothetical protein FWC57_05170 [Endomicrobia bacterium]|nr:hypothetical protein [Endomicrobiia bacterium]